jgi:NAD(P)-dependent dehydrogenase (short-subunit alcohol dehydrogenase family)
MIADFSLTDRVAIVTGTAPGGIGETYARALAEAGAAVMCADINGSGAEAVAQGIRDDGGRADSVMIDIADHDLVRAGVDATLKAFGGIDILVNNAALMAAAIGPTIVEYPADLWQQVFDVNVRGTWNCCRAVVPAMTERGGGRIINQGSIGAFQAHGVYGITKLAVVGLTTSLARELGPVGISVNCIAPGVTLSKTVGARLGAQKSAYMAALEEQAALRPVGVPADLCGALLLLASDAGNWITGQVLVVDGGVILHR